MTGQRGSTESWRRVSATVPADDGFGRDVTAGWIGGGDGWLTRAMPPTLATVRESARQEIWCSDWRLPGHRARR